MISDPREIATPAERVEVIERIRRGLHELRVADGGPVVDDLPLPEESLRWLVRIRLALCADAAEVAAYLKLQHAFNDYLKTLPPIEAVELRRRVTEFFETAQGILAVE